MLTLDDAAFLDDLEARIPLDDWTDEETERLWKLRGYRIPPAHIRQHYLRGDHQRAINEVRTKVVNAMVERLKGKPTDPFTRYNLEDVTLADKQRILNAGNNTP